MHELTYKDVIKNLFRYFGFDISLIKKELPPPCIFNTNVVIDVGANTGQYAKLIRNSGYTGRIVSFEPLPDAHEKLTKFSDNDDLWSVHERVALGSENTNSVINLSKNSYSSSLLPMMQSHLAAAPNSLYIGKAETKVITLDSVFDKYVNPNENVFLKIDTQGYEDQVLNGAIESLDKIFSVQLELSLVQLYGGQQLYLYYIEKLLSLGFNLWSVEPAFISSSTGQTMQFDGIFIRNQ
jgi:FkbM family methyltransferase